MTTETYTATVKPLGDHNGYEIRVYLNGKYESKQVLSWRKARRISRRVGFGYPETGATLYTRKILENMKKRNESCEVLEAQAWWVTL